MDKSIYVAMTGARAAMQSQAVVANNLANATSTGFRAVRQSLESAPVTGPGFPSRINSVVKPESWDQSAGEIVATGQELDIAIQGDGWIAVQDSNGEEAYTRAGNLHLSPDGLLETAEGQLVLGSTGPITVPEFASITIKGDGRISVVPAGQTPDTVAEVATIKLVNPDPADVYRGTDGLFRTKDGSAAPVDAGVSVLAGHLEGSNVNTTDALITMIAAARDYEMHVRAMSSAEENDQAATRLMRMS